MAKKFQSFSDIALEICKPAIVKARSEYFFEIIKHWPELLDTKWHEYITPLKCIWVTETRARLVVTCTHPALAVDFRAESANLIDAINRMFGCKIFCDIKVEVAK